MNQHLRVQLAYDCGRIRRAMGWATVLMAAWSMGFGLWAVATVLGLGLPWPFLLEPAMYVVFGPVLARVAWKFFVPCSVLPDRRHLLSTDDYYGRW